MNKEQVKGETQKGVGAAKDAAGKILNNDRLRAEGLADKAAGQAKKNVGDVKEAVHKATR